jgi:hypothetical protein
MVNSILIGVLLFAFALIFVLWKIVINSKHPYKKKDFLMTAAEFNFYKSLKHVANSYGFDVFTHVRLADLVNVDYRLALNKWKWFYKSAYKHIDFVICDQQNGRILFLVELDDSSHNMIERIKRDNFVDRALAGAKMELVRINPQKYYSKEQINNLFLTISNPT